MVEEKWFCMMYDMFGWLCDKKVLLIHPIPRIKVKVKAYKLYQS